MKIIDLLNKIANEEDVPRKISYYGEKYTTNNALENEHRNEDGIAFTARHFMVPPFLNDEIEIIEENKKIEKINMEWFKQVDMFDHKNIEIAIQMLSQQLNELIDEVNKLKGGSDANR